MQNSNDVITPTNNDPQPAGKRHTVYWLVGIGIAILICLGAFACIFSGVYLYLSIPDRLSELHNQLTQVAPFSPPNAAATQTQTAGNELAAAAGRWPLVFIETFAEDTNTWDTGKYKSKYADLDRIIQDGRYRIEVNSQEDFDWWQIPDLPSLGDFYLAVEVKQVSGSKNNSFGLTFRDSDEGTYVFIVADDGTYSLQVLKGDHWTTLIDWMDTKTLHPGEMNKLSVIAQGQLISLFINNQLVGQIEDDKNSEGQVGLSVLVIGADQAVFEFDNFELRAPEGQPTDPGVDSAGLY